MRKLRTASLVLLVSILVGCAPANVPQSFENRPVEALSEETPLSESAAVSLPAPQFSIGIYVWKNGKYRRVSEYAAYFPQNDQDKKWVKDTWTYSYTNLICDIDYFAVFPSNEETISFSAWDTTWLDLWNKAGLAGYHIGYEFSIALQSGETIRFTVTSPEDTFRKEEYFELYLYDGVKHAHDSRYSHVTVKDYTDATFLTSVKVTLRNRCYEIDHIDLVAFYYTNEKDVSALSAFDRASCRIRRG